MRKSKSYEPGKIAAEKNVMDSAKSFDYDNLLLYLRQLREEEYKKKKEAEERHVMLQKSEARPMLRMFDQEYIKGKGMKNGGYGGLIVGNHYKIKNQI